MVCWSGSAGEPEITTYSPPIDFDLGTTASSGTDLLHTGSKQKNIVKIAEMPAVMYKHSALIENRPCLLLGPQLLRFFL